MSKPSCENVDCKTKEPRVLYYVGMKEEFVIGACDNVEIWCPNCIKRDREAIEGIYSPICPSCGAELTGFKYKEIAIAEYDFTKYMGGEYKIDRKENLHNFIRIGEEGDERTGFFCPCCGRKFTNYKDTAKKILKGEIK